MTDRMVGNDRPTGADRSRGVSRVRRHHRRGVRPEPSLLAVDDEDHVALHHVPDLFLRMVGLMEIDRVRRDVVLRREP
jgi:hypothetical protein